MVAVEGGEFGEIFIARLLFFPAAPTDASGQDSANRPDDD